MNPRSSTLTLALTLTLTLTLTATNSASAQPLPPAPPLPAAPAATAAPHAPPGTPAGGLVFGLYAPNEPWAGLAERYIQRMASHVAVVTGVMPCTARVFTTQKEFEEAVRAGTVQFAVVDALYLAEHPMRVLAEGQDHGQPVRAWALYSDGPATAVALKGKTLAFPEVAGAELELLSNALMGGELDAGRWFAASRATATDVTAAAAAVAQHEADAVFCPPEAQRDLTKVLDADPIPIAGFVVTAPALPAPVVDAVAKAVLAWSADGPIDSWAASGSDPFEKLRARLAPHTKAPIMAEPGPALPPPLGAGVIVAKPVPYSDYGTPDDFYWRPRPTGKPGRSE